MQLNEFLALFQSSRQVSTTKDGFPVFAVHCPTHSDKSPSLMVTGTNDRILLNCQAGCDTNSILSALKIKYSDLYYNSSSSKPKENVKVSFSDWLNERGIPTDNVDLAPVSFGSYRKANGDLSGKIQGISFAYPNDASHNISLSKNQEGKYYQNWTGKRENNVWCWQANGDIDEGTLYITEGEKDGLALAQNGYCTASAVAAVGLNTKDIAFLKTQFSDSIDRVRLCFDNDEAGSKGASKTAKNIKSEWNVEVEILSWPEKELQKADITDLTARWKTNFVDNFSKSKWNTYTKSLKAASENKKAPVNSEDYTKFDICKLAEPYVDDYMIAEGTEFTLVIARVENTDHWQTVRQDFILHKIATTYPKLPASKIEAIKKTILYQAKQFSWVEAMRQPIIPFKNGVYDIENREFRQAREDELIIDPQHNYDRKLEKPQKLLKALKTWFPLATEEDITYLLSMLAYYCFTPHKNLQIWFNWIGGGGNGKSILREIIALLVGKNKVAQVDFSSWNNFTTASFLQSTHIFAPDSNHYVKCPDIIKNLTGDSSTIVEPKGKNAFSFENNWKLIASTNKYIKSNDKSYAWVRRLHVVPFDVKIENPDPKYLEKLVSDNEIERIATYLCSFCSDIEERGSLPSAPDWCIKATKETRNQNDTLADWYDECSEEIENEITVSELYRLYADWVEENGGDKAKPVALRRFGGENGEFMRVAKGQFRFVKKRNIKSVIRIDRELENYKQEEII